MHVQRCLGLRRPVTNRNNDFKCNTAATLFLIVTTLNEEWSSQLWMQFIQLRKKPEKKIQDFNGIWTGDFTIPVRCSNQLRYEATDAGSWSKNFSCDLPCVRSPKRGWESFGSSFSLLSWMKCSGARNGLVVRALASYQCGHDSRFWVCCLLFAAIVPLKFAVMTTNRAC